MACAPMAVAAPRPRPAGTLAASAAAPRPPAFARPPPPPGDESMAAPAPGSPKVPRYGLRFPGLAIDIASGFGFVARVTAAVIPPGHGAVDDAGSAASKCFSQYIAPKSSSTAKSVFEAPASTISER